MVLDTARARMDDDVFPEALVNWLGVLKRDRRKRPYKPPRQNREPMPAELFRRLLAKADEWAGIDWRVYANSLPLPHGGDKRMRALRRRNNVTIAQNRKRTGLMAHSMLCLAANVGAMPIDFTRLTWSELVLDGDLPLYREDRAKPAHLLGSEVPRCCPLLPETVRSLKRWQQHRQSEIAEHGAPAELHARFVFTNHEPAAYDQQESYGVSKLLRQVLDAVDCGHWKFRHLRNIGSTLCRDNHLPEAAADAWLGHSARGTNKFYTGEAKDDYLQPLVRLIEASYFRTDGNGS